jgi:DNA-binding CsgD family transcriptional regulator
VTGDGDADGDAEQTAIRPVRTRAHVAQAQSLRHRLAGADDGEALAEAHDALGDVLSMAVLRGDREARIGGVLEGTRQPALLADGRRWCLDANAAAAELLGVRRADLRLHRLDDFVPRRFAQALDQRWARLEDGSSAASLVLVTAGGREVTAGYTATSDLAADRHLIVVERIDGVRYVPWRRSLDAQRGAPVLRRREREVLALVAAGRTSAAIAQELALSRNTVESHIRNAVVRLGACNRTHAVVLAIGRGEIGLPGPSAPRGG